jgi:biopolymer transport protein ExbB
VHLSMETIQQLLFIAREFGGPVVLVLGVLSVTATTLALFKLWQFAAGRVGRHRRAREAIDLWFEGSRSDAYGLVADDVSPLSRVVGHAMRGMTHGQENLTLVREDVIRVAQEQLYELRRYLRGLDFIAQTSPLLGLFGTVLGMIEAFSQLEAAGAAVDPSQLAGGIWTALITTAVGLAIAIPTALVVAWFESRIENERAVMETTLAGFFAHRLTDSQMRAMDEVSTIPGGLEAHAH